MATGYPIDFTNQDSSRTFQLQPYTTNGPKNPNTVAFDDKASSAATTLLLFGRGVPNYGERIQENLLHLLENFASDEEPVYPIEGQLWYDRGVTPAQLKVYNPIKYQIVADTPSAANTFALVPPTATEKAEMVARFNALASKKVRIFQASGVKEDYLLLGSPVAVENAGNVVLTVTPTPPGVRTGGTWYVGGWEYVLQNNAPLHEDLDAQGLWSVLNLRYPTVDDEAANKLYVDDTVAAAVASSNELDELTDVTLTIPSVNEVLTFNGSVWTNSNILNNYLPLTGGTLTGNLSFGNTARVVDLLDPVNLKDAATKFYVDQEIAAITTGGAIPANLVDLTDVSYTGSLVTNTLLNYNGTFWTNQTHADFITLNDIAQTTGITMTGQLTLNGDPALSLEAATKQYVDNTISTEISSAIAALPDDNFVNSGFYDSGTNEIILGFVDGSTLNIFVPIDSAGEHTLEEIADSTDFPITPIASIGGQVFRDDGYQSATDTNVILGEITTIHDLSIGDLAVPKQTVVFTANGTGATFYLGDSTGSPAPADIAHAQADVGMQYLAGYGVLNVYVDGVRQTVSERGYTKITGEPAGSPATSGRLYPYMNTGLSDATPYDFSVAVDGGVSTVYTVNVSYGVIGSYRFGELIDEINNIAVGFSVFMERGYLVFYSNTTGTNSAVSVTDGGGVNADLFASIVGDETNAGGILISPPFNNTNPFTPQTRDLTEETAQVGDLVTNFTLSSIPTGGAIVEVVIDQFVNIKALRQWNSN